MTEVKLPLNLFYIILRNAYTHGDESLLDETVTLTGESAVVLHNVILSFNEEAHKDVLLGLLNFQEVDDGGEKN